MAYIRKPSQTFKMYHFPQSNLFLITRNIWMVAVKYTEDLLVFWSLFMQSIERQIVYPIFIVRITTVLTKRYNRCRPVPSGCDYNTKVDIWIYKTTSFRMIKENFTKHLIINGERNKSNIIHRRNSVTTSHLSAIKSLTVPESIHGVNKYWVISLRFVL